MTNMKGIHSAVLELFHVYGQTDRRSDFNRRFAGLRAGLETDRK
jgi:hypothetical protein